MLSEELNEQNVIVEENILAMAERNPSVSTRRISTHLRLWQTELYQATLHHPGQIEGGLLRRTRCMVKITRRWRDPVSVLFARAFSDSQYSEH